MYLLRSTYKCLEMILTFRLIYKINFLLPTYIIIILNIKYIRIKFFKVDLLYHSIRIRFTN